MMIILDFYLSSKYIFYIMNIILAVIIPVITIMIFFECPIREMIIESVIGIIMIFIIGGYENLKQGYWKYKKGQ